MIIKEMCRRYSLTQVALAKRFGIPYRTVQDWYAERRTPPDYVVWAMVELLQAEKNPAEGELKTGGDAFGLPTDSSFC